jgi:hypothetical protein
MAEIDIFPGRSTASTGSAGTTITHSFKVPSGKRWLLDYIEVAFGTQHASNTCNIQLDLNDAGSAANIWIELSNFKLQGVDFATKYPRSLELEANDQIEVVYVRSGADSTIATTLHYIERDV